MKVSTTKKSTVACKKQLVDAFGGKLPPKYYWKRSKTGSTFDKGAKIIWSLHDKVKKKVIAKVINTGPNRKIYLDQTVFTRIETKKPKRNPKRRRKMPQFPPPFKPSDSLLDKLAQKYKVHENPDPPDCETCGMKYRDLRTGLDFKSVQDMLFVDNEDPELWRQKGRHSVLGLWFEIKRNMWDDHISMCQDPESQEEWLEDFEPSDFEYGAGVEEAGF